MINILLRINATKHINKTTIYPYNEAKIYMTEKCMAERRYMEGILIVLLDLKVKAIFNYRHCHHWLD